MRREEIERWFKKVQGEKETGYNLDRSMNRLHDVMINDLQKLSEILLFSTEEYKAIHVCADIAHIAMILAYKIHKNAGRGCLPLNAKDTS